MTSNLKSLAFVHNVSLFSVVYVIVLATFGTFHRRRLNQKKPHVDLRAAGKNFPHINPDWGPRKRRSELRYDANIVLNRSAVNLLVDREKFGLSFSLWFYSI